MIQSTHESVLIADVHTSCHAGNTATKASETNRVWLETITRSATHLLGIINDIITLQAARTSMHLKQELVRGMPYSDIATFNALPPLVEAN